MNLTAINQKDCYKMGHPFQYPDHTEVVYSNFTPRSGRLANTGLDYIIWAGLQGKMQWLLVELFDKTFFKVPKAKAVAKYKRRVDSMLGPDAITMHHVEALHDLGFLPVRIKSLPEGSKVPYKVPVFTIMNTHGDQEFGWVTNMLETMLSTECWKTPTSATTAHAYRLIMEKYAELTGSPKEFIDWQCHDFSMRGMSGLHDAAQSGMGHLLSFTGTDTAPALDYLEDYYFADSDKELLGGSVPASEHSVMCAGGATNEVETIRRLIEDIYPSGVVSVVSDTWDFWNVITNTAVELKDVILNRTPNALGMAKVVFRPDSGDPVKIICGDCYIVQKGIFLTSYHWNDARDAGYSYIQQDGIYYKLTLVDCVTTFEEVTNPAPEVKGAVECLWDVFGGTETVEGYKVLNERVGLIYGDSITLERAEAILSGLEAKGFASCNIVLGIGSYTYQYVTRDTHGFAMKATYTKVNGEERELFKDPITDSGEKKSAKGLMRVELEDGEYVMYDQQTWEQESQGELKVVFEDGKLYNQQSLAEIRQRLVGS